MFTGVIESKSHEGGFLVSFTGSSPALESIIINSESGIYIGKVDAVLGNTDAPLAHVAHIDRKLDLDALIGVEVGIRAKKQREERDRGFDRGRRDDRRGNDRGFDRNDRGRRDDRRGNDRGYQSRDRQGGRFERNDRGRRDDRSSGDWDCPKCNNSNFAFRTECNRCGEPKGAGGGNNHRHRGDRRGNDRGYQSRDRQGGRFERNDRGRRDDRSAGDWDCPKCNNSNFAFRTECNRCGEPRGAGGGNSRGRRDDRRGNDRGYQNRDRQGGRFERNDRGRGGNNRRGSGETYNDNDWDCPKCNNSNFAFRTECNRCGEPRSGGGGRRQRRDDGGRPPRRDDRSRAPRRESGDRPPRREDGGRPPRRDGRDRRNEGGYENRGSYSQERPERRPKEPRTFRKSRGNGPGHAHNRPPKPIGRRRDDDA